MDVSVIVPVYNGERYIDQMMDCLIRQKTKCLYEIIAIDDGSKDNSYKLLKEWEKKNEIIKVFTQSNSGPSQARNFGLSKATGKYILFVDIDDIVSVDYINHLYIETLKEAKLGVVISGIIAWNKDKRYKLYSIIPKRYKRSEFGIMFNEQKVCYRGYSVSKLYSKDIIEKYKLRFNTDVRYAEDMLFFLNYLLYAEWISYIDKYDYYYKVQNSNSLILSYNSFKSEIIGFLEFCKLLDTFKKTKLFLSSYLNESFGWSGHFAARAICTITKPGKYFIPSHTKRVSLISNHFHKIDLSLQYENKKQLELKERIIISLLYWKKYKILDLFCYLYYSVRYSTLFQQQTKTKG